MTACMVPAGNVAIAKQISAKAGLDTNIFPAESLTDGVREGGLDAESMRRIEEADGFAQLTPQHEFAVVKALQSEQPIRGSPSA